jgi:hypothetical protein
MLRAEIIPSAPANANASSADHGDAPPPSPLARMSWARLLKRIVDIDIDKNGALMFPTTPHP